MGVLDGPLAGLSASLLRTFGTSAVLRVLSRPQYDPAKGAITPVPTDTAVKVLVEEYPDLLTQGGSRDTEEGIRRGDRKVTLAAQGIAEPRPGTHQLVISGETWRIVKVDAQRATDQAVLYVLQVRR